MAAARSILLIFTSSYLLFLFYKLTLLSDHHHPSPTFSHQTLEDFVESLTIFKSIQIQPKYPNAYISVPEAVDSYTDDNKGWPVIDENDVVVLTGKNFSEFVDKNRYVMVMFYAPWCYWSQKLAPEYAAAAKLLKGDAVLAMVDASQESGLGNKHLVQGFPTMHFFVNGVKKYLYNPESRRRRDVIATWVKRKLAIGIHNLATMDEARDIVTSESDLVLAALDSLEGLDSEELAAASKLVSDINFYQTADANIAELFLISPQVKRPALVLMLPGRSYHFDGQFTRSAISNFVNTRKVSPVITFTLQDATSIFDNPLKKLWLFASTSDSEVISIFEEAAEAFRGKLLFVHVDLDNWSFGKQLAYEFGTSEDASTVVTYDNYEHHSKKHVFNGELTLNNIKCFAEDFLNNKLHSKTNPASETILKLSSQSRSSSQLHLHK